MYICTIECNPMYKFKVFITEVIVKGGVALDCIIFRGVHYILNQPLICTVVPNEVLYSVRTVLHIDSSICWSKK